MKNFIPYLLVLLLTAGLQACGERQPQEQVYPPVYPGAEIISDQQSEFFDNLYALCGETFVGEATYPDNSGHPLVDTELRTHISECDDSMVRIELIRDGDYWHGAWVIEKREDGLHLYHDHLGEVRTMDDLGEDDAHGYGGYASDAGSATHQFFPADDATAEMLPEAATNVWMMELDLENDRFIYYLERHDEPRFRAELFRQ